MIVVYPFSTGDQDLALKNAKWIKELGGCKGHQVLAIWDKRCVSGIVNEVGDSLRESFDQVHLLEAPAEFDGWPEGANYFFRIASSWIEQSRRWPSFMWMEPDAIPLTPGWLDLIEKEYVACQRPFMGDRVQVGDIPLHMSGVGIYPNPLHKFAGEAYRAAEIAWDMAGKDQIVPQAYFTKLIEHAWKHPTFSSREELRTQIAPETILFHSSKDGSLIDLLRGGAVAARSAHNQEVAGSIPAPATPVLKNDNPAITCDIFIRTYPGDYEWLRHCLRSIKQYAKGFRKVWIVSPGPNPFGSDMEIEAEWKQINDETEDGYLAQQITKLYADVLTDYQADFICHLDSDVIFTREVTPEHFFAGGKLIWYYTPYSQIETPWQPITEKFLGQPVQHEFMRRFPMMVPRWLYPKLREFCHRKHGMIISDYIRNQPLRAFSEFNALGAYAHAYQVYFANMIEWVNTMEGQMPEPHARQFHSWSGLTPEVTKEIEQILRGTDSGSATTKEAHTHPGVVETSVPSQIKELPNGIWVIKDDTHVSKWVEQEQRLDHDQNTLPFILPLIKKGDTVVDIGAFIGDHTIAYRQKTGHSGRVHAFEPNPIAFQCLVHNMLNLGILDVHCFSVALGDRNEMVPLSGNNGNAAGAYLGQHMKIADVPMETLDAFHLSPDFIKIDAEGCELKILKGAVKTIEAHRPVIVMEVNVVALARQGVKPEQLFDFLSAYGYDWKIIQENCVKSSPMYDIIATSASKPSAVETPPVATIPGNFSTAQAVQLLVNQLQEIADQSAGNKAIVTSRLVLSGLRPVNPNKKKKHGNKNLKKAAQAG